MKKILLLCGMLLAISATVASAGPLSLAWENCRSGGGASNKNFACNTNTGGGHTLVASVAAPAGIDLWNSFEGEYMLTFAGNQPAWWQLRNQTGQTGQCRNGSISANAIGAGLTGCSDLYSGNGAGGIGTYQNGPNIPAGEETGPAPNKARLLLVFAIPAGNEAPLTPGEEYFVAKVVINNAKTVNSLCTGCADDACVELVGVKIGQPAGSPGGNPEIRQVLGDPSGLATWQVDNGSIDICLPQVPARRATWGSVKSLYR